MLESSKFATTVADYQFWNKWPDMQDNETCLMHPYFLWHKGQSLGIICYIFRSGHLIMTQFFHLYASL